MNISDSMFSRLFSRIRSPSSGFRRMSTVSIEAESTQVQQLKQQLAECHARRERFWNRLFFAQMVCMPVAVLADPPSWFSEMMSGPIEPKV